MFSEVCGLQPHKSPVSCVSIVLTGDLRTQLDPNLEPNKQKVGLGCLQAVVTGLETILSQIWATEVTEEALGELDVVGGVESDAAVLAPLAPTLLVLVLKLLKFIACNVKRL